MRSRILVVEGDTDQRRRISGWLDDAGYDEVMMCPGPGAPAYECIGSTGVACPLAKAADIVLVDLHLRSDEAMRGTPAWHLMLSYYEQGKPIVALWGPEDPVHPLPDDGVAVVTRPADRDQILDAIASFERSPAERGPDHTRRAPAPARRRPA